MLFRVPGQRDMVYYDVLIAPVDLDGVYCNDRLLTVVCQLHLCIWIVFIVTALWGNDYCCMLLALVRLDGVWCSSRMQVDYYVLIVPVGLDGCGGVLHLHVLVAHQCPSPETARAQF